MLVSVKVPAKEVRRLRSDVPGANDTRLPTRRATCQDPNPNPKRMTQSPHRNASSARPRGRRAPGNKRNADVQNCVREINM